MYYCSKYQTCEAVIAPFIEGRYPGGVGWIFPKRSPFLPIFNQFYWDIKEAGLLDRIWAQPKYSPNKLLPKHECETLDGHPIHMHKVISLFTMLFGAFCCSLIILGYVHHF